MTESESGDDPDSPVPPLVPLLAYNPLFLSDSESEDDMQRVTLPSFAGREKGAAGLAYLRAFNDAIGMQKMGGPDEKLFRSLYLFASGGSAASATDQSATPFDLWCDLYVRPLAQTIHAASTDAATNAAHTAVYNQYRGQYEQVLESFKVEFCGPDVSEFKSLLTEIAHVCQTHHNSSLWRPLQHALLKLQGFYSRPVPSGVISEGELVVQLLSLSDLLPETVSLRIKSVVDGLPAAQLPAAPANPPAGWEARRTLAAVLAAVSELARLQHQAAGWGML